MDLEPEGIVPPDTDQQAGRDPVALAVEALLDEDRPEEALAAIEAALAEGRGNAIDLEFLAGDACLGMGRARDAEERFRRVLEQDPDCPSSRCWLAMALFLQWRFDEAEVACRAARALPDAIPDSHVVEGLLLEHRGQFEAADACFELGAALAPEKYQKPTRLSRAAFDREVRQAARKLPRQFRQYFERVPVSVHDLPHRELAFDGAGDELVHEHVAPDILGLFDGVPLPETAELDVAQLRPNTIYLFQRNLERAARDPEDLIEQIRITLWHELGHYLGFEEEDMDDLGLA
ncbi:MAG: metallopeptidase family protein [Planctomycetes bacterium]|nr:metallopeptidase family protein [Planctomycetota bacterium]